MELGRAHPISYVDLLPLGPLGESRGYLPNLIFQLFFSECKAGVRLNMHSTSINAINTRGLTPVLFLCGYTQY